MKEYRNVPGPWCDCGRASWKNAGDQLIECKKCHKIFKYDEWITKTREKTLKKPIKSWPDPLSRIKKEMADRGHL